MANAVPTAEEIAEYEKLASASAPAPEFNPIRDLSSDELFDLSIKDSENFNLLSQFRQNKNLWQDQATIDKVADVNNRIKQRGFSLSDIPSAKKIAGTVFDIAKGFGKQAWNYASALVGAPIASAIGEVTGDANVGDFNTQLRQDAQRKVMENLSGTESAMFGVARMGQKVASKVARLAGKSFDQYAPEEKVEDLWADVGTGEVEEDITKGQGGFMTPIGANVRQELEAAGKPIRPEETQLLAAGDPAAFFTFGKAFQAVGRAVPARVTTAAEKVVEKAGDVAEVAAGKTVSALGTLTDLGGKVVKKAGPAVGFVKGAVEAGPIGALAGLKGGEIAAKVGGKISKVGKALESAGDEIAVTPKSAGTQLVRDVAGSAPVAAFEVGKGLAFDIGTAAVSSERPEDTQSVGIGAFFGAMGAGQRAGRRIISGQIVAPREWGSDTTVPSSGSFPLLDGMHDTAMASAAPAVKTRLNAVREFARGVNPNLDVFLAGDAPALEKALADSGVTPETAKRFADQDGFFMTDVNGRKVIIVRNADAAPHEAFHAVQDVLGEGGNQSVDSIVRQEYGPQWEVEGERYANRITPTGDRNWREVILDETGYGLNYAKEKIAQSVSNEYRASTGAEPPAGFVQDRAKAILGKVMDAAVQNNPNVDPNLVSKHVWRDILSADESAAVADTYLARELAAENFDMVFKNLGASLQSDKGVIRRLANVVANLVSTFGGEPLAPERTSQIGNISPKFKVTEAVADAARNVPPAAEIVQPKQPAAPKPIVPVPTPKVAPESTPKAPESGQNPDAVEARKLAESAPETPVEGGTQTQREILGQMAEAIAQQAGVKINYLSAPDMPAAATTSNRDVRRAIIEAFRTMPAEARALWEKNFFPERVIKLKDNRFQIMGWAPEVFASNAHKLAGKLVELGVAEASPYEIKGESFSPKGWQDLFADTQKFVQNQSAGRTGAGESIIVPEDIRARGFFAPPERGAVAGLDQTKADFINTLFGIRLPDTARIQKGKLPRNIAAQEVSAATKPGRVEVPVIPRGQFEGAEAERQGIAGREVMEVNPFRQQLEAAAQAQGKTMPEFIEAIQRLSLENIKEVQTTPEQPQFRGNEFILAAGFQPKPDNVRAVSTAAVKDAEGKTYAGMWHGVAREHATERGAKGPLTDGFLTNGGEFLTRDEAFARAKETKQISEDAKPGLPEGLESTQVRFQPKGPEATAKEVGAMSPEEFFEWAKTQQGGFTPIAHKVGLEAPSSEFVSFLEGAAAAFREKGMEMMKAGGIENMEKAGSVFSQAQFFREAWEAATGEGSAGFHFREKDPNYTPKFPQKKLDTGSEDATMSGEMSTQLQPKTAQKEFKLKPAKAGFSKAWITPEGAPIQLGGQWHHYFMNSAPEVRAKYGLEVEENQDANRIAALKKGFMRVNWNQSNGMLTVEGREKDWRKQRAAIRNFVDKNAGDIDSIRVILFDEPVKAVAQDESVKVFEMEDNEKAAHLPLLDLDESRVTGEASDRLFNRAVREADEKRVGDAPRVGLEFKKFFSDVTKGEFGKSEVPLEPLRPLTEAEQQAVETFSKHSGNFDQHIRKSIPGFSETQLRKIEGIAKTFGDGARLLDIAASEGSFGKTITEVSNGSVKTVSLDPNPDMAKFFDGKSKVPGATYSKEAFLNSFEDGGETYKAHDTDVPYDVITESMGFQFIDPDRKSQFAEVKRLLAPDGVFLTEQKVRNPQWKENEAKKDSEYKAKYFSTEDLKQKDTRVGFAQSKGEEKAVGMVDNMAEQSSLEEALLENFKYVVQYWDSGNFKGYAASDKLTKLDDLIKNIGDTGTDFSTVETPRWVDDPVPATTQFQPKRAADEDLFGNKPTFSPKEVADMSREEIMEFFPEAVVPAKEKEMIQSRIVESPLFKQAGSEEKAVEAFAERLVEFARTQKGNPIYRAGLEWYDKFTPMLKEEFGENADLMAELLAATSPQTNVETNFAYALDALESFKSGRFDKIMTKFNQGLDMLNDGRWETWYARNVKDIPNPPKEPTPAAFLEHWIFKHDLKPTQSNGKLYGQHSLPVLQVFARKWLDLNRGPKTLNFVENLLGKGDEATIDLWADRTMRRIGYAGKDRWRILPKNQAGVSDTDFAFSQKAFRRAAKQLGVKPSALQGGLWFAEKQLWADNGWSRLDLGDFRNEMKKLPLLRSGVKQRLTTKKLSDKVKPAEELELDIVKPRYEK